MIDANGNVISLPEVEILIDSVIETDNAENAGCTVELVPGNLVTTQLSFAYYGLTDVGETDVAVPYTMKITVPHESFELMYVSVKGTRTKIKGSEQPVVDDFITEFYSDIQQTAPKYYYIDGSIVVESSDQLGTNVKWSSCKAPFDGYVVDYNGKDSVIYTTTKVTACFRRITREVELVLDGFYDNPYPDGDYSYVEARMAIGCVSLNVLDDFPYHIRDYSKKHAGKDTYYLLNIDVPIEMLFQIKATVLLPGSEFKCWKQEIWNQSTYTFQTVSSNETYAVITHEEWHSNREYTFWACFSNDKIIYDPSNEKIVYDPRTDKIVRRQ